MTQVSSGNFPIPNDTGANVLADINENLEALQSNNASTTAPAVGKAHQFWVDESTTPDTLKIRGNTDNASFIPLGKIEPNLGMMPISGGTFTGAIETSAGSSVAPSLKISDPNTGFFEIATDQIGVTCGGLNSLTVSPVGLSIAGNRSLFLNNTNDSAAVVLKAQATLSSSYTLQLPLDDGEAGEVLKTDGNGVTSWTAIQGVPTGTIMPFAGSTPPSGYLECNGGQISTTTYNDLFLICGYTYSWGQTPNSGNFFLPDLRGIFVRGWDHGKNIDSSRTRGSYQAESNKQHTHTVASSSIANTGGDHGHAIRPIRLNQNNGAVNVTLGSGQSYNVGYAYNDNQGNVVAGNAVKNSGDFASNISSTLSLTLNNDGGSESRPKNIALMYIIKI